MTEKLHQLQFGKKYGELTLAPDLFSTGEANPRRFNMLSLFFWVGLNAVSLNGDSLGPLARKFWRGSSLM